MLIPIQKAGLQINLRLLDFRFYLGGNNTFCGAATQENRTYRVIVIRRPQRGTRLCGPFVQSLYPCYLVILFSSCILAISSSCYLCLFWSPVLFSLFSGSVFFVFWYLIEGC